jgi:4-diphosphocytidyl-2-C-methyl-D-erythritol kinase
VLSPAKINISLRILGKRPDGFHEIDTLMAKLPGLADRITITPAGSFSLTCDDPSLPTDSGNLIVRAAESLAGEAGEALPFHIHLEKRIPHGAGLGGGSSNAATILLALNAFLTKPLPSAKLHALAAELGSDIPFFLLPGAARCTGRGEIISPAPDPPALPIVLLKPNFPVPTPDAYRNCLSAAALPGIRYDPQHCEGLVFTNELEQPVFAKHRYLAELKEWLLRHRATRVALMSGSGSTIFAILPPDAVPEELIGDALRDFDPNLWAWSGSL